MSKFVNGVLVFVVEYGVENSGVRDDGKFKIGIFC